MGSVLINQSGIKLHTLFDLRGNIPSFISITDAKVHAKSNTELRRLYSSPVDRTMGVICDQTVQVAGQNSLKTYPEKLRRIKYHDQQTGKRFTFLTNHFALDAITIADLYKCRWQV